MNKKLSIEGYSIEITTGEGPNDAKLAINGKDIPVRYYAGFRGWKLPHTLFGVYPDLETLAYHLIQTRPSLRLGHGDPSNDPDDDHHHNMQGSGG
ncbi:MAG: hypothetical protein ACFE0J_06710 [Elainellaceae cyanobacterium]